MLPCFNPIRTENTAKTLNFFFFYSGFLKTKWRRLCTFERHNIVTNAHSVFANKTIGEMICLVRNAFHI